MVELLRKLRKNNTAGAPIYAYINNVLMFQTASRKEFTEGSGISKESVYKGFSGSLIFGAIKINSIFIDGCATNLLSVSEFKDLVSSLRLSFRRDKMLTIVVKRIEYVNSKKVYVVATNILTGKIYMAPIILDISKLLKTLGPKEYVLPSTISVSIRNNKPTKRWIFQPKM